MSVHATRNTQHAVRKLMPRLLSWFSANARDLPWRRTHDPYAIWVSEIMLQQTQVKTVIPYWERWMRELPTIQSAAKASSAKLHKLWEGLGYYTRVRNLHKAAQQIVAEHNGNFPKNFDDILALPGIGRYTAGAICSIAFNQPRPILDGNVIRVLTRIFGIAADPREKQTNAQLWQIAEELVREAARLNSSCSSRREEALSNRLLPIQRRQSDQSLLTSAATRDDSPTCSHLNQSLMELGALICTPRSPKCDVCPVNKLCIARKWNLQEKIPNLGKRKGATALRLIAFVIERNGKFLVRQRPNGVVNAHLWEFPNAEVLGAPSSRRRVPMAIYRKLASETLALPGCDLRLASTQPLCTIKHSITRYRITLEAWRAELTDARPGTPVSDPARNRNPASNKPGRRPALHGQWLTLPQLHKLAFTSAHKKILAQLESERRSPTRRVS